MQFKVALTAYFCFGIIKSYGLSIGKDYSVGVQIAEAIEQANDVNAENKDPDSVFISGNSRPCLIDFLMFGTLRQLKDLNALSCLASPTAINWFNTVDDVLQLLQIRRRLQYWDVCCTHFWIMALEFLSKKKWNPSNTKVGVMFVV